MPETFTPYTWADGSAGGTPITAAQLNRIETGVESMDDRVAAAEALLGATTTVYALSPPVGSGLAAITANGTTNDVAALQAQLSYVSATWGGGRVVLPSGRSIKCNTGLTLPAKVQLVSDESTTLDFTSMATSGTAITVNDTGFTPMRGVRLVGPESSGSVSTTSIGVSVTGVRLRFYDCMVKYFGRGWDWAHSNTWLISLIGGDIEKCGTCIYNDNVAAAAGNAGEQMVVNNVTLFNSGRAINVTGAGVDFKMTDCAIDFCAEFGYISDAWVYFTSCHMETQGGTSGTHLFDVRGNSKVSFANCDIIMGGGTTNTLNYLFNHFQGPSNYGNGQAHFSNTKVYCVKPGGVGDVTQWSEQLYEWPNDSTTTTMDIFTPYPLFWCPVSAHEVAQTFRNTSTTQATIGCSSPSGNLSFGDLRLTSTPGYKMIRVRFG
jgi:hypothetical protein